jgi:CRISPR-associated protein Csb1
MSETIAENTIPAPKVSSAADLLAALQNGCGGKEYAAVRIRTKLLPMAGKVFPPTYQGGQYATEGEKKNAQGEIEAAESVLLDSVQSQANRMESALLSAINSGRLRLPIIRVKVEFGEGTERYVYPNINSYTVPHRVSDAIIRDSVVIKEGPENGRHFYESTEGMEVTEATIHNARAFFKYCPTALLFGTWDSHSFVKRGLKSAKVARALCSEVIGLDARPGKRTASRVDPLHLSGFTLKKSGDGNYGWEIVEKKPDKKAKETKGVIKISEIGHGNVTPDFKSETGEKYAGGFEIREALQTALLSFAQLRRLSFAKDIEELIASCPAANEERAKLLKNVKAKATSKDAKEKAAFPQEEFKELEIVNVAGRAVIAALGLVAVVLLQESPDGFNLRSRCDLLPVKEAEFEFLPLRGEKGKPYAISPEIAIDALEKAVNAAKGLGLEWIEAPVELEAGPELKSLIVASEKAQESDEPS